MDIKNRVKIFEDALRITGDAPVPSFSDVPEKDREYFIALYKMRVIVKALNEGWIPDWDNFFECKWRPWFVMSPSGFAFYISDYATGYSYAGSGSGLCFRNRELSDYCAKQFIGLWEIIQLG